MNKKLFWFLSVCLILWGGARYNYLLFHSLVDIWALGIALLAGYVGLTTYPYTRNRLVAGIGVMFLAVGAVDLIHTLGYEGMGVFPSFTADQPTQLWILARWIQSLGFLSLLVFHRRERFLLPFGAFLFLGAAIGVTCVVSGLFPACYIPGSGVTPFKIVNEFVVSIFLTVGAFTVMRSADPAVRPYRTVFVTSIFLTVASELVFTVYSDVYGFVNMMGHLFKVASYGVLLEGFLIPSVRDPLVTLFGPMVTDREALLGAMTGPSGILGEGGRVFGANQHLNSSGIRLDGRDLPAVDDLLPEAGRDVLFELGRAVSSGEPQHFEFREKGRDYRAGIYPMPLTGAGKEGQFAFMAWDVTPEKKAQNELEMTKGSLLQAQEMALLGTFRVQLPSGEVACSKSLRDLLSLPVDVPIDFQWYLDHIHEEDRERVDEVRQAAWREGKEHYRFECRIRRADGVIRYFRVWARAFRDVDGEVVGLVGTFQDNTDQVFLQRELEASRERYRSYIEKAPVGVIILDERSRIIEVNRASCAMTGYGRDELLEMKLHDLYPDDQKELSEHRFGRLLSNGAQTFEAPFLRRDGTCGFWEVNSVPLSDDTYMGLVQDLSVRYEALDKARRSQERFKTLFETIMEGFGIHEAILDGEGNLFDYRFLEVNPAFEDLTGLSARAIRGKTAREVFNDLEGHWFETYRDVVRTGESVRFRGFAAELGRWYEVLAFPMGENRFATAFRDVSREQVHEEALEKIHLELEAHVTKLEKAWEQTIRVLAEITEFRDPYTSGHQRRVAAIAEAICLEMGLDKAITSETVRSALVHDIGKIKIPSDFLSKPGRLSEKEFRIIRRHPISAVELLKGIDLPWPLGDIVGQHHERMDGSGYPKGLAGEEILLQARIIAVADVVEAMASDRPYRAALGIESALEEIEKGAGGIYDAEVAAACLRLFREKGYILPEQV